MFCKQFPHLTPINFYNTRSLIRSLARSPHPPFARPRPISAQPKTAPQFALATPLCYN